MPDTEKGNWTYLYAESGGSEPIGAVVRSRTGVRPVFVSPGNLIDIQACVEIVVRCATLFRIPEPLRQADLISRERIRRYDLGAGQSGENRA